MTEDRVADAGKRRFLAATTGLVGAAGVGLLAVPFVRSLEPDASIRAASTTTVDLAHIEPGMQVTVNWQDKPVAVVRRTPEMLETLKEVVPRLRDPDSSEPQQPSYCKNPYRSIKPEWLVMVMVCTHLCCVPLYKPQKGSVEASWEGGFHCPCHGSFYDLAGRVFKDVPAPRNLAIPEYGFSEDGRRVTITAMAPGAQLC
jgi:ubiquinol-cytochrome c reductase iron-sulfur subunit